ncbi:MAG: hypothetical protein LBU65_06220 [Planctomycetaceae bacterium]|jgi:hypothetical protein|nr:hypothetical protein [Planctomycetaceae bacterium]
MKTLIQLPVVFYKQSANVQTESQQSMSNTASKHKLPNIEKLKLKKTRRRLPYFLLIVSFLGAGFLIGTYAMNAGDRPLVISPQNTGFVEPLKNGGREVDFFAATKTMYEPHSTDEPNAFTKLLTVTGKTILNDRTPDWFWNALCTELQLDPKFQPSAKFVPLHKYLELTFPDNSEYAEDDYPPIQRQRIVYEDVTTKAWSLKDHPYLNDWLTANKQVLDTLVECSRSNILFCPRLWRSDKDLPETQVGNNAVTTMRLIDALICRAMSRLSDETNEVGETSGEQNVTEKPKSNRDAALDDLIAAYRFAKLMTNSVWVSDRQLLPAIDKQPLTEPPAKLLSALRAANFDKDQLKRLAVQLDRLPREQFGLIDIFTVGQYESLDVVSGLACGRLSRTNPMLVEFLPAESKGDGIDWSIVARSVTRFYTETLSILLEQDPLKQATMLEVPGVLERSESRQSSWYIPSRRSRSEQIGDLLAIRSSTLPKALCLYEYRRRAWDDMFRLAVALERYKQEHNNYPNTLEKLEPNFITSIPTDPFTNSKPYRYKLESSPNVTDEDAASGNAYILYSVSVDLKDDGGYKQEELMTKGDGDIRVRMPLDANYYKLKIEVDVENKP